MKSCRSDRIVWIQRPFLEESTVASPCFNCIHGRLGMPPISAKGNTGLRFDWTGWHPSCGSHFPFDKVLPAAGTFRYRALYANRYRALDEGKAVNEGTCAISAKGRHRRAKHGTRFNRRRRPQDQIQLMPSMCGSSEPLAEPLVWFAALVAWFAEVITTVRCGRPCSSGAMRRIVRDAVGLAFQKFPWFGRLGWQHSVGLRSASTILRR